FLVEGARNFYFCRGPGRSGIVMSDSQLRQLLADRLQAIDMRIHNACQRSGRSRSDVTLIAVTKTISTEAAAILPEVGLYDLGEGRSQELWKKVAALPATVRWHMVGHLQRNKIEHTLPLVTCIHSVDSDRLLAALEEEAAKQGRSMDALLEVNASREQSKHGFAPQNLPLLVPQIAVLK